MPLEPSVTEMLILRDYGSSLRRVAERGKEVESQRAGGLTPVSNGYGLLAFRRAGRHRWQDPAKGPDAEKPFPAGVASVCREAQQAFGERQGAAIHPLARNVPQIKIPAPWAVGEMRKNQRHSPGVKPPVAGMATPGTGPCKREPEVHYPGSMRAKAVRAAAPRADHNPQPR